ncbi:hypothetical protein, partial [Pseudomonas aeruginosa]|uniref:hypothetical protein n=1 Tax=Pseudomonas aeruginosa TaxID=287 RepID=UPI0039693364
MYLYIETLKQRLDAINQLRLERATASMSETFSKVYSLLPVLLASVQAVEAGVVPRLV